MICLAAEQDALNIAKMHKQEIKTGFLSSLPVSFLEKLYLAIIKNDFCVVEKDGEEIKGFLSGTKNIKKFYSYFFIKYFFYSFLILLPKIFSYSNFKKILENLFYPEKESGLPEAELLTIAVKGDLRGKGIAKNMFDFFVLEMEQRGVKSFKVLVGEKLKPAISFYESRGFKFLKEEEVHKGQRSRVYIYEL